MRVPTIPKSFHVLKAKEFAPVKKAFTDAWGDITRAVNGRLNFGSPQDQSKKLTGNLDGTWPGTLAGGYTILTPAANVEFTVTHNLGRIPTGYDVKGRDQAAIVYDSRRANWTTKQMFLKCNVAGVNLILFVH